MIFAWKNVLRITKSSNRAIFPYPMIDRVRHWSSPTHGWYVICERFMLLGWFFLAFQIKKEKTKTKQNKKLS